MHKSQASRYAGGRWAGEWPVPGRVPAGPRGRDPACVVLDTRMNVKARRSADRWRLQP